MSEENGGLPRLIRPMHLVRSLVDARFRKQVRHYRLLRASPLFDSAWYRRHYPDVSASKVDPAWHYLLKGAREGREPGPLFNAGSYLAANPDVARSGGNPLVHYLQYGQNEGRPLHGPSSLGPSAESDGATVEPGEDCQDAGPEGQADPTPSPDEAIRIAFIEESGLFDEAFYAGGR